MWNRIPGCPRSFCGVDVDDLLAYSTIKRVTIRDARLGALFYLFTLGIAVYILIYQLVWDGGYLAFETPINTVRLTLQQPTEQNGKSCNPNKAACQDNFTSPTLLPYCWDKNRPLQNVSGKSYNTLNCSYMDGSEVAAIRQSSVLMTTAVHAYQQQKNPACGGSPGTPAASTCPKLWDITSDDSWYVIDPERFTILLDHSVTAKDVKVNHSTSLGFLYVSEDSPDGDRLCKENDGVDSIWRGYRTSEAPCYITPMRVQENDYFTVGFLLKAMGTSLDEPSEEPDADETKRWGGLIIRIDIEYHNFQRFHLGTWSQVRYVYRLNKIVGSGYKETRLVNTDYPNQRVKQDLHGILFEIQGAGSLAAFDFTNMLFQLTTSLALFALATTVVNILAQYILKYSAFYRKAMYSVSPDFSDLRLACALSDDQLEAELRTMGLREDGDRVSKIMRLLAAGWSEGHGTNGYPPEAVADAASLGSGSFSSRRARAPAAAGAGAEPFIGS